MNTSLNLVNRRRFIKTATLASLGLSAMGALAAAPASARRKFTLCLACGPVGVPGDPRKEIAWASQFGFEAIEPAPGFLGKLTATELQDYLGEMKAKHLTRRCLRPTRCSIGEGVGWAGQPEGWI